MEQIGRYKITGELGRGAMGIVYRATDPAIGRTVAIKTIHLAEFADPAEQGRLRERLLNEARSAGVLSHPGIVTVYDVAEENDLAYIAMEFVSGVSLEQLLSGEQPLSAETVLRVLREAAAALDYAHQNGIVHRDIKPANIMVDADGRVKITDFGVAKISASHQLTQAGVILGTPSYMSPEQVQGKPVDGRSDVFSLAVIAFEMLTGEKPFVGDQLPTLVYKIVHDQPAPAHLINPTLSWQVELVLRKALEKDPETRYRTCAEFVKALEGACRSSKGWKPLRRGGLEALPTVVTEAAPLSLEPAAAAGAGRRRRKATLAGGLALIVAVALSLVYFTRPREGAPAPEGGPAGSEQAEPGAATSGRPSPAGPPAGAPAPARTSDSVPQEPPPVEEQAKPVTVDQPKAATATAPQKAEPSPPSPQPPVEPGEVEVRIRTTPPGATVVLDNDPVRNCKTPCTLPVKAGRHTAAARLAGHRSALRIFQAPADTDVFMYLAATSGQVQILTSPAGANVQINGDPRRETTPLTLDLPTGKYTVTVTLEGYKSDQQSIEVKDNAFTRLEFILGK